MSKHNETGVKGEQIAENFLVKKGYGILHRNWCSGKKEIDLIAEKDGLLIFVEVKTRSATAFGFPEEAVDARKQAFLRFAAAAYLELNPHFEQMQFDVVSVRLSGEAVTEIIHFEDAF